METFSPNCCRTLAFRAKVTTTKECGKKFKFN